MVSFQSSRYNFAVKSSDGQIGFFNALTGGLLKFDGTDASYLAELLLNPNSIFSAEDFSSELLAQLCRAGQIIPRHKDEISEIRERFWKARGETPVVLTITTTMDCNLGCYYCYEERSGKKLSAADVTQVVEQAEALVQKSDRRALHVDWYGGEPLLNLEFIERASIALQDLCGRRGFSYVSSIISNGSSWPDEVEDFVERHRIRQVQISFDGLKQNHDKRRRYRKGYGGEGLSSFDRAVALVDKLVNCTRVDVRFNIDQGNAQDLLPFIDFARNRGWFAAPFPAVFQPARLAAYSENSSFMKSHQLSLSEFDSLRATVRRELDGQAKIEESEVPDGYPFPRTSVCAALAANSIVIGADRNTYHCGLQVGETGREVGNIYTTTEEKLPKDNNWWSSFDPTIQPSCSKCSFLPVCWGGCPKKHLEGDKHSLDEQSRYWRTNLPRLIAKACDFSDFDNAPVPESLQFRERPMPLDSNQEATL